MKRVKRKSLESYIIIRLIFFSMLIFLMAGFLAWFEGIETI